jgi:hypothetical protein
MQRLRELMQKHAWVGWVLTLALLAVSVFFYTRLSASGGSYSVERMTENLTIKCVETGDEWTIKRGIMEKQLRGRGSELNPLEGLPNPKTGKLTGFPKNTEWEETVTRINKEKAALAERRP